ncbi:MULTISPECIES: glycerol-3-phosphate 1-O-acyltransferase PlsY [unclassified Synechococcus]|uniref:glycerol-3-phosphate 1-O-acyltransferase PlsY n=1 Tax=unclassified Synechococcus TaxID=2626047 RepID=UPI0039C06DDF
MPTLFAALLAALGGYLLGSIPTGYWVGRWWGGIDLRQQGSGSTGATNVLRTLGKGPALLVLLVDAAKGAAAVALGSALGSPWWVVVAALGAVIGHSRSCWLGFKGGKSVATSLGILLAMAWPVALATCGVWLLGIALTRIVSFSSLLAAVVAPLLMWAMAQPLPYVLFALAGGVYVIGAHRRNIERLLAGSEPRIGQKLAQSP